MDQDGMLERTVPFQQKVSVRRNDADYPLLSYFYSYPMQLLFYTDTSPAIRLITPITTCLLSSAKVHDPLLSNELF